MGFFVVLPLVRLVCLLVVAPICRCLWRLWALVVNLSCRRVSLAAYLSRSSMMYGKKAGKSMKPMMKEMPKKAVKKAAAKKKKK